MFVFTTSFHATLFQGLPVNINVRMVYSYIHYGIILLGKYHNALFLF